MAAPAMAMRLGSGAGISDNDHRMNDVTGGNSGPSRHSGPGAVRRRHVIYVSGYDPRGAKGYFELFRRTCERFQQLWLLSLSLQPLQIDSDDFAHWAMTLHGPDWQVATHYDFLRMENFIRADMGQPAARQALRALGWYADDVVSGAQFRIFRAAWRFAVHLLCFQWLALAWAAAASIVGIAVGYTLTEFLGSPTLPGIVVAVAAACLVFLALAPLAQRLRLFQIGSCWSTLRRFGRGRTTWIDGVIDVGARRLVAAARANKADELVVVGHSTGGVIASAITARALELDANLGISGPRLVLLTLGSVMPAVALHPAAQRMRTIVGRLAIAKNLTWIDCQSRKDVMCFANFDPVASVGVDPGIQRCNPLLWRITFRDMIAPEHYNRFRWNHFRVHYQYVLGGDRPAPYDYVLLVGGPMPVSEWPRRDREFAALLLHNEAARGEPPRGDVVASAAP